jgi:hypothetical protein
MLGNKKCRTLAGTGMSILNPASQPKVLTSDGSFSKTTDYVPIKKVTTKTNETISLGNKLPYPMQCVHAAIASGTAIVQRKRYQSDGHLRRTGVDSLSPAYH